jgi:hypothetical protein
MFQTNMQLPIRGKWRSHGNVIKLCEVVYYLGRNKIPYQCNNMDTIYIPAIQVYDLDIKFKSNRQFIAFKKRFG